MVLAISSPFKLFPMTRSIQPYGRSLAEAFIEFCKSKRDCHFGEIFFKFQKIVVDKKDS